MKLISEIFLNIYILVLVGYNKHDYASSQKTGQNANMFKTQYRGYNFTVVIPNLPGISRSPIIMSLQSLPIYYRPHS